MGADLSARIKHMLKSLKSAQESRVPISITKALLVTESFRRTEGEPTVIRCAKALEHVLKHIPVFIEPTDLIAGNYSSVPGAVELSCLWAGWEDSELDALNRNGFAVNDEDRTGILAMNEFWRARSLTARMAQLYDEGRLWPYAQLGVVLPAFRSKEEGWGPGGMIGVGWGIHHEISQIIGVFQFDKVLRVGLRGLITEAESELRETRLFTAEAVEKVDLLKAVIIALRAIVGYAHRLAICADQGAASEQNSARRGELQGMAAALRQVPVNPARTFREALQSLWVMILMVLPSGVLSFGRLDQLLYPFYQRDRESGLLAESEALELLQWLRIKDSRVIITAGQTHRSKYGGLAKWHNCVVGGQSPDGADATNDLTYLILRAALECPAPHPTLTLRVHDGTPERLLDAALEVIASGLGMPAFLADNSCIDFLTGEGVPLEEARDYAVAGCLGINLPGKSRTVAWPMFTAPLVFEFALYGGVDPRSGKQVGPLTPDLVSCSTYEQFRDAVYAQLGHFAELQAEFNNVTMRAYAERFPQTVESAISDGLLQSGKNILSGPLPFENGSALNPIGLINVADSLTAVRKLVFDDRCVSAADLVAALRNNWGGKEGERIRKLALSAPKYGNDDDYADEAAVGLFDFWAWKAAQLSTVYGGKFKAASITIGTAVWPGGTQTGATPDGRLAGEILADESLSPMRGRDHRGVNAVLRSALKIRQSKWQALSLDLRFDPDVLRRRERRHEFIALVRDYFARGGKHIQFNAVKNEVLAAARSEPGRHQDLIVRIGGCSAFFVQLPEPVQAALMERTEFQCVG